MAPMHLDLTLAAKVTLQGFKAMREPLRQRSKHLSKAHL